MHYLLKAVLTLQHFLIESLNSIRLYDFNLFTLVIILFLSDLELLGPDIIA